MNRDMSEPSAEPDELDRQEEKGTQEGQIEQDREYMRMAIELAKKGEGWCHPNPLVGAVIVKDGRVIGKGYHEKYGQLHAERNAIGSLREPADGATLYVTLEPCCHYGKTPPCTEAIIENGISKVFVGSRDPNPLVAGKGVQILRDAGIEVVEDFLRKECDSLNRIFFHYITNKDPYVILKYAMTADGKVATKTGKARWITGPESLHRVHEMRNQCMAIMVGIGTVLADDPMLNCRIEGGRDPVRVICDSRLRIPLDSQIARTAGDYSADTVVACSFEGLPEGELCCAKRHPADLNELDEPKIGRPAVKKAGGGEICRKAAKLNEMGVRIINVPGADGRVDVAGLVRALGQNGVDSILIEGGGGLNESVLRENIVDEVRIFIAPKIFGGRARTPVEGEGVSSPDEAMRLTFSSIERIGDDIMITCRKGVQEEK